MAKARTIGIGVDYSTTSKSALKWAIDNLINTGDTIVVILVLSPKSDPANKKLFADTGSPLIPLVEFKEVGVCKKYGITPDTELFNLLDTLCMTKRVNVVAKVYWGDPREKLCESCKLSQTMISLLLVQKSGAIKKRWWVRLVVEAVLGSVVVGRLGSGDDD
ncbi:universal stress protein PHOS34 [Tanacetum coccineum]